MWAGGCSNPACVLPKGHREACKETAMSEEDYEVECITDQRRTPDGLEYLVKWVGWPAEDSTCMPLPALTPSQNCVR